jgi:hypothetical protein
MGINKDLIAAARSLPHTDPGPLPAGDALRAALAAEPRPPCPCVTATPDDFDRARYQAAVRYLFGHPDPRVKEEADALLVEEFNSMMHHEVAFVEQLQRHLPAVAFAIGLVAEHVWESRREDCAECLVGPGLDA